LQLNASMRTKRNIFEDIDWILVVLFLLLCAFGWSSIYAATYDEMHQSIFDMSRNHGKQLLWIGLALIISLTILLLDNRFFETFAYPLYGIAMTLLLGVLIVGTEIKGAKSWFVFGGFSLQPSEFAKFATALALSKLLSSSENAFAKLSSKVKAIGIILLPALLITLQPDVGSTLVYLSFLIVLYRVGLNQWIFILGFIAIIVFVTALVLKQYEWEIGSWLLSGKIAFMISFTLLAAGVYYLLRKVRGALLVTAISYVGIIGYFLSVDYVFDHVLKPHHQNRINELLGIVSDPTGAGYNVHQSMIAIGSGGFSGKGFLQGTQTKFNFVPEQSTDFIFCTVGEEWGFLGTFVVICLFMALIIRIAWLADQQRSTFTQLYGYSVAGIFFLHFIINIGMTIGLAPVIGIPLPFFSYGGSSLWAFTLLLFTFIKLDSERKYVLR